MKRRARAKPVDPTLVELNIESLTLEGKGVAHHDGKAVFVTGGLPTERVMAQRTVQKRTFDEATVVEVLEASSERVTPKCAHFGVCNGCSWQHLAPESQIHYKQQALLDNLYHIGKVSPATVFNPLRADVWGYRRKARLGVRYVSAKGKVLVGFREQNGRYLAELQRCEILHPSVGEQLLALQSLIAGLSIKDQIAQIEMTVGDNATALVFRNLAPLTENDLSALSAYGAEHEQQIYLQPKGPDSVYCIYPAQPVLYYEHPTFQTRVEFAPQDFVQVNQSINRLMVVRALELLQLNADDVVLDLFCGLGNFTLPLAKQVRHVVGVEGDSLMVKRAKQAALANGLSNTEYFVTNLMDTDALAQSAWLKGRYDKILLDPPRAGAQEVIPYLAKLKATRIVYVSCNPATLARDAALLVAAGYRLQGAGVMDMFPHTAHVESIAVFER